MKNSSIRLVQTRCVAATFCMGLLLLYLTAPATVHAQTLTTLYNFCSLSECFDGEVPEAGLIQAANGNRSFPRSLHSW